MLKKVKQHKNDHQYTSQNRLPNSRSRTFLTSYIRGRRVIRSSSYIRGSLGFLRWLFASTWAKEQRHGVRASCFISGRSRGTNQRYTISRTKVKHFVAAATLFGVRKSSW